MPDQPDLPIDDEPPAELDPMGATRGQGDQARASELFADEQAAGLR